MEYFEGIIKDLSNFLNSQNAPISAVMPVINFSENQLEDAFIECKA